MPVLSIRHLTRYRYRNPVALGEHRMMFRPRESYDQRLISTHLLITPTPTQLRYMQDVFGNTVGVANFSGRTDTLEFVSHVELEHTPLPAFHDIDGGVGVYRGVIPFEYAPEDLPDLRRSIQPQYPDPDGALNAWARRFVNDTGTTGLAHLLSEMTEAIHAEFDYETRLLHGPQSPQETIERGSGSCRDFAVLMIEAVRSLGLAARFVSGYLYSPPRRLDGKARVGGGHTHAWVRVYLPACGWVEFDPTNGIVGNTDLIRVGVSVDPRQATPLYGSWSGFPDDYLGMDVEVDVTCREGCERQPLSKLSIA
jgi:transglutaminase-like putative cysteine protease